MLNILFTEIYSRNLQQVVEEVKEYKTDDDLWLLKDGISNSGGNLALHLAGNINHFFGAVIGNNGYQRERDLEFSDKNLPREEVAKRLENAKAVLVETLSSMTDEDFQRDYPEEFGGGKQTTGAVVIYMLSHLNYHLGQINYHRRLFSK